MTRHADDSYRASCARVVPACPGTGGCVRPCFSPFASSRRANVSRSQTAIIGPRRERYPSFREYRIAREAFE